MRKKVNLLFLSILSATFLMELNAQSSKKEIISEFFQIFQSEPIRAMEYASSTNKWLERNIKEKEALIMDFKKLLPLLGKYNGYELITKKRVGANVKLRSYILKYDRQPIRFTFVFYRANEKWHILNLYWDVYLIDEIVESSKKNRN